MIINDKCVDEIHLLKDLEEITTHTKFNTKKSKKSKKRLQKLKEINPKVIIVIIHIEKFKGFGIDFNMEAMLMRRTQLKNEINLPK